MLNASQPSAPCWLSIGTKSVSAFTSMRLYSHLSIRLSFRLLHFTHSSPPTATPFCWSKRTLLTGRRWRPRARLALHRAAKRVAVPIVALLRKRFPPVGYYLLRQFGQLVLWM